MTKIAMVELPSLRVVNIYEGGSTFGNLGASWIRSPMGIDIVIPDSIDPAMGHVVLREDGEYVFEEDPIKVQAKQTELLNKLRQKRNLLLSECDWTQLVDTPLTAEQRQEWATYRQALRDLPSTTQDLANPTWPTKPT